MKLMPYILLIGVVYAEIGEGFWGQPCDYALTTNVVQCLEIGRGKILPNKPSTELQEACLDITKCLEDYQELCEGTDVRKHIERVKSYCDGIMNSSALPSSSFWFLFIALLTVLLHHGPGMLMR